MNKPRYDVGTIDPDTGKYTPQRGVRCRNLTIHGLRRALKALRNMAAESRAAWFTASCDNGNCDEKLLIDLRATAIVALDICEMTLEEMEAYLA